MPGRAAAPAPLIQAKLRIGRPDDAFEQEADRMAELVVAGAAAPSVTAGVTSAARGLVQRLADDKNPSLADRVVTEEDHKSDAGAPAVQRLPSAGGVSGGAPRVGGDPAARITSGSGGEAMAAPVRTFMESRFGDSFADVRIHTDPEAGSLANDLGARAFTYDRHVWFASGEYRPETESGQRILAHELTHVIQQRGGRAHAGVQRMSARGAAVQSGVQPWGPPGPTGTDYQVQTDAGSALTGWDAYSPITPRLHYWCHGHSLGTYARFSYSVYSGPPMATAIHDEWHSVPPAQTQAGDIAVWTGGYDHSAIFTNPVITSGALDPATSMLSSKNGKAALGPYTLNQLAGVYGGAGIAVFRHN